MPILATDYLNDIKMKVMECMHCGIIYAATHNFIDARTDNGKPFYCPKGCRSTFGEGTVGRLERELESMKNSRNFHENESNHLRRSRAAIKGKITKIKKRIANGVCPCCNRHFKNVHRHMKGQHPDFKVGA